jgi:5,6,7,8-tetrahydromethanopterin hydro-lyase
VSTRERLGNDDLDGRIGEGFAGAGLSSVHVNLALARTGTSSGAAAARLLMSPSAGHVPFLLCAPAGTLVRPATVVINKVPLNHPNLETAMWGGIQLGLAQAVLDAVAEGVIDAALAGSLVLSVAVSFNGGLRDVELEPAHETALRTSARAAMRDAIVDATHVVDDGALAALVAARDALTNDYYGGE